jgi:hypothetical protein
VWAGSLLLCTFLSQMVDSEPHQKQSSTCFFHVSSQDSAPGLVSLQNTAATLNCPSSLICPPI